MEDCITCSKQSFECTPWHVSGHSLLLTGVYNGAAIQKLQHNTILYNTIQSMVLQILYGLTSQWLPACAVQVTHE